MHLTGRLVALTLEGLVLLALIAGAAYVSIGRILVSSIDSFESQIEARATAALNVPVSFDRIEGSWEYFDPTLTLEGVRLGDGLTLGRLSARVNTLASTLERGVVISELTIDGIDLDVVQLEDGRWQVVGLPLGEGNGIDPAPLLRSIPHLDRVVVSGVDVGVSGQLRQYRLRNQPGTALELVVDDDHRRLSMPLSFEDQEAGNNEFELVGRYRGDPRDLETFFADLYLHLPLLELSDFVPLGGDRLAASELTLRGDFWLQCADGRWEFRALPVVERLVMRRDGQNVEVARNLTGTLAAQGRPFDQLQVQATKLSGRILETAIEFEDVVLAIERPDSGVNLAAQLAGLDVGTTVRLGRELGSRLGIVTPDLEEALLALNPRGRLDALHITAALQEDQTDFRMAAGLNGVSVDSHRKSPVVEALDGLLVVHPGGGYVDIADDDFGIGFPGAYDNVWRFDKGAGRLTFDLTAGYPRIASSLLQVADGEMTASGRIQISLPEPRIDRTWGLELGVLNADLPDADRFVPNTVDAGLRAWLKRSITRGHSDRAGMVFHGTLDQVAPDGSKTFGLFFDVRNTTLAYDAAWPAVEDLDAVISVSNRGVFAADATGTLLDSGFVASVAVPMGRGRPPDAIVINGDVKGELSDGLRVLQETPLLQQTGRLAEQWVADGHYSGTVSLNVPIGRREGEAVDADVMVALEGNSIFMGDIDLPVEDVTSHISYATATGLRSPSFTATVFGEPVSGEISSEADGLGGAVRLYLRGMASMDDLRNWSGQRILRAAEGDFDYFAVLHVPYGDRAKDLTYIEATSTLEGVAVDLPPPMGKTAEGRRAFVYRQSFLNDGFRVDLRLDEEVRASLKTVAGEIVGGQIHFGAGQLGAVAYDDLDVSGELAFVDYDRWEAATNYLLPESGEAVEMAGTLDAIEVDIDRLLLFNVELDNVATRITRDPGVWHVGLTNDMLDGRISVPDINDPIRIGLEYLHLPEDAEEDGEDPLADIDPTELVAIDFSTEELKVGEEDYGRWSFLFRPHSEGATLSNIEANVRGLMLSPDDAVVEWSTSGESPSSHFTGGVLIPDLASAFRQWGFASSVEGKDLKLAADLDWGGSPAMIDLYRVEGGVEILEGSGRFVQAESGTGALRLLGIFDFASLARRFRFDFSDVVNSGLTFSELYGKVRLDQGTLTVVDPIFIVGSGSRFKIGGTVDLYTNALDNDMIVTLPVSRNLPWYAAYSAIVTGPLVGAGVWLANKIFENQIDQMSSAKYRIEGTIDKPVIEFVSIFDDSVRESPDETSEAPNPAQETTSVTQQENNGS